MESLANVPIVRGLMFSARYNNAWLSGRRILVRLPAALDCRGRTPHLGVTSTFPTCRYSHEDRVVEAV